MEYVERRKYPGLIPVECAIWSEFVKGHPRFFNSVEYNVRVGEGVEPVASVEEQYPGLTRTLTAKRIDAVGWSDDTPTIVEVKDAARMTALGEIVTYVELYKQTFRYAGVLPVIVVCVDVDPDLVDIFADRNVDLFQVEVDIRRYRR